MVLNYFKIDFPTLGKEITYCRRYGAKSTKGTLGSAIAFALAEKAKEAGKELDIKLVHSSENMLENKDNYFDDTLFEKILAEHKKYIKKGENLFDVKINPQISAETLQSEIENENLVIVQCFVEGTDEVDKNHKKVMHWILIYGFDEKGFRCCDPLSGKIDISEDQMDEYIKTPFDKTYISIGEKKN